VTATKTRSKSVIAKKLDHLNALINHAGTTAIEAEVAKAARAKLVKALQQAGEQPGSEPGFTWEPRWAGALWEHGRYRGTTEIAALIRAAIKVARQMAKYRPQPGEVAIPDPFDPIAKAPAGIRYGVRKRSEGSITVQVMNIPADWGYGPYGDGYNETSQAPSPALCELGEALNSLAGQWNFNDSDSQSDHFHYGYGVSVTDEQRHPIDRMPPAYRARWAA
jgi:hypothetical protein